MAERFEASDFFSDASADPKDTNRLRSEAAQHQYLDNLRKVIAALGGTEGIVLPASMRFDEAEGSPDAPPQPPGPKAPGSADIMSEIERLLVAPTQSGAFDPSGVPLADPTKKERRSTLLGGIGETLALLGALRSAGVAPGLLQSALGGIGGAAERAKGEREKARQEKIQFGEKRAQEQASAGQADKAARLQVALARLQGAQGQEAAQTKVENEAGAARTKFENEIELQRRELESNKAVAQIKATGEADEKALATLRARVADIDTSLGRLDTAETNLFSQSRQVADAKLHKLQTERNTIQNALGDPKLGSAQRESFNAQLKALDTEAQRWSGYLLDPGSAPGVAARIEQMRTERLKYIAQRETYDAILRSQLGYAAPEAGPRSEAETLSILQGNLTEKEITGADTPPPPPPPPPPPVSKGGSLATDMTREALRSVIRSRVVGAGTLLGGAEALGIGGAARNVAGAFGVGGANAPADTESALSSLRASNPRVAALFDRALAGEEKATKALINLYAKGTGTLEDALAAAAAQE